MPREFCRKYGCKVSRYIYETSQGRMYEDIANIESHPGLIVKNFFRAHKHQENASLEKEIIETSGLCGDCKLIGKFNT